MESSQCPLSSSNPKILRIFGSRAKPISSLHILRKKAHSYTLPSMAPAEGVVENRQRRPNIGQNHDRAARSKDTAIRRRNCAIVGTPNAAPRAFNCHFTGMLHISLILIALSSSKIASIEPPNRHIDRFLEEFSYPNDLFLQ